MKRYFIYLLLLFPIYLSAQHTVRVERCHSFPEGEPVHCLHIEGDRLWLGTSKGMFFYSYKYNRRNILEDMAVTAILRDSVGRLWSANDKGVIMTSDRQNKIKISENGFNPFVTQMTTKFDQLWVATAEQGIYVYSLKNFKKLAHYTESNSKLPSNSVNFVQFDKRGNVWAGTSKGVCSILGDKIKVFEKGDNVTAVTEYNGDIWFIGNKKLWKIDSQNRWAQVKLDNKLSNGVVRDMTFDDEGRLYAASNIFSRYDIIADTMAVYGKDVGFVSDQSLCTASDGNGDIWVGTKENGLFRFELYYNEEEAPDDLTAICYSEKTLKCSGDTDGELVVKVDGGKPPYSYKWSKEECKGDNPKSLKAGKYIVTVTDQSGATVAVGARVHQPKGVSFRLVDLQHLSRPGANDGLIEIEGAGGIGDYTYKWEDNSTSPIRKRLGKGTYAVMIADENNCTFGVNFEIKGPKILPELQASNVVAGETIAIEQLYFKADSTQFDISSIDVLNEVYDFLRKNSNIKVEIGGHTNDLPADDYCDWLSNLRAKSVADYLYEKGIPASQLSYKGYGKRNPIATNKSKAGRAKNQRVEIKVLEVK